MKEDNRKFEHNYQTIYELLWDSEEEITDEFKEQVNEMIYKLPDNIKKYIKLAYGDNLENPVRSPLWSKDDTIYFYSYIVPRLKYRIDNPNWKRINEIKIKQTQSNEWKYLYKIKLESIDSIKSLFTEKQLIIIRMLLGFDGKNYKTKEIANYLNTTNVDIMNELKIISSICKEYFQEDILNNKSK